MWQLVRSDRTAGPGRTSHASRLQARFFSVAAARAVTRGLLNTPAQRLEIFGPFQRVLEGVRGGWDQRENPVSNGFYSTRTCKR